MGNNIIDAIILGIAATIIYELLKKFVLIILYSLKKRTLLFSIDGFWCTFHESKSELNGLVYSAYELLHLKYNKGNIYLKLYQVTNDNRNYLYKGIGYIRGDKIVIAYEEAKSDKSNHVGALMLRQNNFYEHSIVLQGNYIEFRGNRQSVKPYKYILKNCCLPLKTKINFLLCRDKNIYNFMKKNEDFRSECKQKM